MKVNAKLMGTSNNATLFDEDDPSIACRVQYCLHENQLVDDDALVDGVHVFKKVEFESCRSPPRNVLLDCSSRSDLC
jgi:hypothetical protein